ncbi:MAG: hypothetical protein MUF24_07995 [Chitinophagaceae bacterium]|nr:hypothetical protein [Chitinophagaceae bacterium]
MRLWSSAVNLLYILPMLGQIYRQLRRQRRFMQEHLNPLLQQARLTNDGSLGTEDFKKIENYYSLAVPAVLGEAWAALRGRPLAPNERYAATMLATTTGLYDDYFENKTLSDDYIENLYRYPAQYTGQNSNEKLANYCWREALEKGASAEALTHYAHLVHTAQIASRRQLLPDTSLAEIESTTFDKGGYSVLIYLSVLQAPMDALDTEMLYQAGALLQLENDLFDVYKDQRDGIRTLATMAADIAPLRALYLQRWLLVKQAIAHTSHPAAGKARFRRILSAIVARGFVCLDMLATRQHQNGGVFNPAVFTRKQLICDMEKPQNLLKTLYYFTRYT